MSAVEYQSLPHAALAPPYPGLRPFQAEDAGYFFGRETQIKEIVARLRANRFVSVVGGSGSGKSSLVLAGAIPRLRAYAIKEAGDFWIPVVSTPGTNHAAGDSPLLRLARKFCGELEPALDSERDVNACAALLRERDGLGRMVKKFGRRPKNPDSIDLERADVKVNYLFLIDQFEEIFHPSNVSPSVAADCKALAERIVDQFERPDQQVCVALTMRSEHLNDCPRYQDLPDAINGSSYLVKRLDGDELREAITQPAIRYAERFMARAKQLRRQGKLSGEAWTFAERAFIAGDAVSFDADLLDRLLDDSRQILEQPDHADHLPLLQHVLFWLWHAACSRSNTLCPAQLTMSDLFVAVADVNDLAQEVSAKTNTLETCIENRCEAIYSQYADRAANWALAFQSLAFKEPNSGSYTQQRVEMSILADELQLPSKDELRRYFLPWLEPHGYLHWDTDSDSVKVAHETLIRRWNRLRRWCDDEDRRFQVYLRLLEDCGMWDPDGPDEEGQRLSGAEALRRYDDARLEDILNDERRSGRFLRLLGMDRDGSRLAQNAAHARGFLVASRERQRRLEGERRLREERYKEAERDRQIQLERAAAAEARIAVADARQKAAQAEIEANTAKTKHSNLRHRVVTYVGVLLGVGVVLLAAGVGRLMLRSSLLGAQNSLMESYAVSVETRVNFLPQFFEFQGPQLPLRKALMAANVYDQAREDLRNVLDSGFPSKFAFLENDLIEKVKIIEQWTEPRNLVAIRTVLQGAPWRVDSQIDSRDDTSFSCEPPKDDFSAWTEEVRFFPRGVTEKVGLIVRRLSTGQVMLYSGTTSGAGKCSLLENEPLYSTPPQADARMGVAPDAGIFALELRSASQSNFAIQFNSILWDRVPRAEVRQGPIVIEQKGQRVLKEPIEPLTAQRNRFSADLLLNDMAIRIFDIDPTPIRDRDAARGTAVPIAQNGTCDRLASTLLAEMKKEGNESAREMADDRGGTYCLYVYQVTDSYEPVYLASLYRIDAELFLERGAKPLPLLEQVIVGRSRPPVEYRIHPKEGWFAFKSEETKEWRALVCSLDAVRKLAADVSDPVNETKSFD